MSRVPEHRVGEFRYTLRRDFLSRVLLPDQRRGAVLFIMLNPSTADASKNDPTITRCEGFASAWGFDTLLVGNLFAARSTDPKDLKRLGDPVGPLNDDALVDMAHDASMVIAAWGEKGKLHRRDQHVLALIARIRSVFRIGPATKDGHPRHPLYLAQTLTPEMHRSSKTQRDLDAEAERFRRGTA